MLREKGFVKEGREKKAATGRRQQPLLHDGRAVALFTSFGRRLTFVFGNGKKETGNFPTAHYFFSVHA